LKVIFFILLLSLLLAENLFSIWVHSQSGTFTFTYANCTSLDIRYVNFTKCLVRRNSQNRNVFDLYARMPTSPMSNISVSANFFRKYRNVYRPFLYSDTFNFCEFQLNPKVNIFWNMLYRVLSQHSNINHSCPYDVKYKEFKSINANLYRKYQNAYRPFLYSDTFNLCLLQSNNKINVFWNQMYRIWAKYSNIKYSCPLEIIAKLFRKANNKYRPFLYDDVIDYCEFHNNAKRHIFWNLLYTNLGKFSNMNHSCPYDHDLIVKNLTFDVGNLKVVPIPRGEYMIQYKYLVWTIYRCQLMVYFTRYGSKIDF
ncbi:hypothetical protein FF38_05558, partial [Lucilia cuprina]